ncbi:MAG: hypothetical protein H6581_26695 [Bacteroidia bacterium]|nr:hypothetical protein [Bacteroidia bacterium]
MKNFSLTELLKSPLVTLLGVAVVVFLLGFQGKGGEAHEVMMIGRGDLGGAFGIHVIQNGEEVEFVQLSSNYLKKETNLINEKMLNGIINKYTQQGWKLVAVTLPSYYLQR